MKSETVARSYLRSALALLVVGLSWQAAAVSAQTDAPMAESEDTHDFDFWPGTWVEVVDGKPDASATRFTVRRSVHPAAFEETWRLSYGGAAHEAVALRAGDGDRIGRDPPDLRRSGRRDGTASPLLAAGPVPEPFWEQPRGQILLLGTFHFSDAGLDSYRPEHDIDVFSERRKAEIEEVLDRLAAFRPTKVAVEVMPNRQARLDEAYRAYLAGELELSSNEVHQIGFRLAARLGHERVWAVDAERRFYEPWIDPDEYAAEHGQTEVLEDPWPERYEALYRHEDRLKVEQSLREHLLYRNRPEVALRNAGHYLVESFRAGVRDEYPGVDSKIAWYNRNLRIFANLQRITERDDERILLVIGHGHLGILRHAVEVSPEYRLVEVEKYLAGSAESDGSLPDP